MLKLLSDVAVDGQVDSNRMERFLLRDFAAFNAPLTVLIYKTFIVMKWLIFDHRDLKRI